MQDFVHLHVHSEYSVLDGAIALSSLVRRAKELGMPAVALTDHGNLFGAVEFYKIAKEEGIKPILGMEAYVTSGDMTERDRSERLSHLTLLSMDRTGFRNLIEITSKAHMEGFYWKPRVDKKFLSEHTEGLIALSGCAKGEVPGLLMEGQFDQAEGVAAELRDMFGAENFFLELQDVGLQDNEEILHRLKGTSERMNLQTVATNDVHYLFREDYLSHDVLLCVQTGKKLHQEERMRLPSREFYLRTQQEMASLFADIPEALSNSMKIVEMCELEIDVGHDRLHLPEFDLPEEYSTPHDYLRDLAEAGLRHKVGEIPGNYRERLLGELAIIEQTGYSCYFLIIWDIVKHAREMGVSVGPGRGSAVSSMVLYALDVTQVDPIEYGLLFERFLNPERVSPPDVDLDFGDLDREKVISYVKRRFGEENVCQIVTFGRMKARAVIRDVGRVLDIPYSDVDRIAKLVPTFSASQEVTIDRALAESGELKALIESNDGYKRMIEIARKLEGRVRNVSTHAAGVVIAPGNIRDYAPIYRAANEESLSTQFGMESLEDLGLLKVDLLGLRTLTILEWTEEMVRQKDPEFTMKEIPTDDPETFALLSRGTTLGVFQLESRGMRGLLKQLRPSNFREVIAVVALYRPGPLKGGMLDAFVARKHGREKVRYLLPQFENALKETYGVIVYQEQVMQIAASIAGFSMGQADLLRRAMGKKKASIMAEQEDRFVHGATDRGIEENVARRLFEDEIVPFAGYGFPKSHATGYGLIAYWTAYLKAHHPREFMCANMSAEMAAQNFQDKIGALVKGARKMGISVTPPDVNRSSYRFSLGGDNTIVYGLGAVKNVGEGASEDIIAARKDKPFTSLRNFLMRVSSKKLNKKAAENLIKAGAFDSVASNRTKLLAELQTLSSRHSVDRAAQSTLFGTGATMESESSEFVWDLDTRLAYEKAALGFFLSGHPLAKSSELLKSLRFLTSSALEDRRDNSTVDLVGTLVKLERKRNRRGKLYAQLVFEDFDGEYQGLVFPNKFEELVQDLRKDESYFLKGKLTLQERGYKILLDQVIPLEQAPSLLGRWLVLRLGPGGVDDQAMDTIHEILSKNEGQVPVYVKIGKKLYRSRSLRVALSKELLSGLSSLLGEGNAVIVT